MGVGKRMVAGLMLVIALVFGVMPTAGHASHGDTHTPRGTLLSSGSASLKFTWRLTATNALFGDSRAALSDTAYDTVRFLSAVDVTANLDTAFIRPQDTTVVIKHILNLGNGIDTYQMRSDSTQGFVRGFFVDADGDSAVDGSDPPFTTLVMREITDTVILLRIDTSPTAVDGAQDSIRIVVTSNDASRPSVETSYVLLTVDSQPPTTPTQVSPANGFETTSRRPTFTWSASTDTRSGLAYYRIYVDSVGTFTTPVASETTTSTTYTCTADLAIGRHYWRVRAYDNVGNFTVNTDSFVLVIDSGVSVSLVGPSAGHETTNATVRFEWSSTDAETYTWQLSRVSTFATLADSAVDTKFTVMIRTMAFEDTFYWRVIAKDTAGSFETTTARAITLDSSVAQVTALTPSSGHETTVTTVVLGWSALADSAGLDSYVVEISRTSAFTTTLQVDTIAAIRTNDTIAGIYNDTTYWRVRGIDRLGNVGANSTVRGFVVDTDIGKVVLSTPADSVVTAIARPPLTWTALTDSVGIDSYLIEVSVSPIFATQTFKDTVDGAYTTDTPASNLDNGIYYWRVRAIDNLGNHGAPSDTFTFTVSTNITVSLDSPSAGHETTAAVILFGWSSTHAETYTWQLSRTSAFTTISDSVVDTAATSVVKTFIVQDTYFWRVIGKDRVGNTDTQSRGFVVDSSAGQVAAALSVNGHETSNSKPVVSWTALADSVGIDSYVVEVSRSFTFTGTFTFTDTVDGALTSDTITGLGNDTYYWRVRAIDDLGNIGATSDTRGFVIDTFVGQVTLFAPAADFDTNNTKPFVSWTALTDSVGIDSYVVEVSKSSSFTSLVFADTVAGTKTSDTLSNLYNDTYYWRLRGVDRLRNVGANSDTRRIRVDTQGSSITLTSPADSFASADNTPSLAWSASAPSGVAAFSVRIARTSTFTTLVFQDTPAGNVLGSTASTLTDDTYYWKVIATDNTGSTTASSVGKFFVDVTAPTAPVQVTPVNNHETSNLKPVFTWRAANDTGSGILGYRLEVSRDSRFTTFAFVSDTVRGQLDTGPTSDLVNDTYYWRVIAIDNAGNTVATSNGPFKIAIMDPTGSITFDRTEYKGYREVAQIRLTDPLANTSAALIDVADVTVLSDIDATGFTMQLTETGSNTNLFIGTIMFTSGNTDATSRKIKVIPGSGVTAKRDQTSGKTVTGSARWLNEAGLQPQTDVTNARSWPNPWNPMSGEPLVIQNLPADPGMTIEIYTIDGSKIRTLYNGVGISASSFGNVAQWDGKNDAGQMVASGVYLYVVRSQYGTTVKKITLVK